ncbi:hypothetical protein RJ641_026302 [Dillenia turbinata]|uniref:Uncharacterized protein n=1 Tax=Dillenia turbinata TaxID=194707 RepID=A0AAN8W360_9MAGN
MELQAVPPSVLNPPMSEKAIRTRKKYLRPKEVRPMELRNARERNRKKLGLKILNHVFKKSKRSNGFKFEFQIENEVNEMFKNWANETVLEDQLPDDLVNAYNNFREQVDKHLKPVKARKAFEEEERRVEEAEQQKYAKRAIGDDDILFSCLLTLAEKHESTKREAIRHYTKDLKVSDMNGTE